jgi:hypothetical protein
MWSLNQLSTQRSQLPPPPVKAAAGKATQQPQHHTTYPKSTDVESLKHCICCLGLPAGSRSPTKCQQLPPPRAFQHWQSWQPTISSAGI